METASTLQEELRRIYLFEALSEDQLERLLQSARMQHFKARETVFEAHQPAKRFYLLWHGQVKLFMVSADGDEKVMEIVYPPQTFAEAIMFMQKRVYPLNAQTVSSSELIGFDMKLFLDILQDSQETCFRVMANMSRRLHTRIDDINNLTLHNATYRLVVYLLNQLPEGALELSDIHLGTPKSVIASRLSIQPETFSRILTRLSKKGLISVDGNNISLLDVSGLRALL